MTEVIDARYENGVLRPLSDVNIQEGEIVRISIFGRKRVTENFFKLAAQLSTQKVEGAHKMLEEMRDDRY